MATYLAYRQRQIGEYKGKWRIHIFNKSELCARTEEGQPSAVQHYNTKTVWGKAQSDKEGEQRKVQEAVPQPERRWPFGKCPKEEEDKSKVSKLFKDMAPSIQLLRGRT